MERLLAFVPAAALLGASLAGCGGGPSEADCRDAEAAKAKFFDEDDPDMRAAYYEVQLEAEKACDEWKASQDD